MFNACATISKTLFSYKYLDSFIKAEITAPGNFNTAGLRYFGSLIPLWSLSLINLNNKRSKILIKGIITITPITLNMV